MFVLSCECLCVDCVCCPQSGLDSEKPFVLEKHMSDIDR